MLAEVRPEFAIVTAPPLDAPALIAAALKAGCHVMADKPGAVRLTEFAELVDLSARRRRHLMLAFANRLAPLVLEARQLVRSGALGRLYAGDLVTVSDQARLQASGYAGSWHARKSSAGGGHLIWLGIHYVDLLQFLSGEHIKTVAGLIRNVGGARIEIEDAAALTSNSNTAPSARSNPGTSCRRGTAAGSHYGARVDGCGSFWFPNPRSSGNRPWPGCRPGPCVEPIHRASSTVSTILSSRRQSMPRVALENRPLQRLKASRF